AYFVCFSTPINKLAWNLCCVPIGTSKNLFGENGGCEEFLNIIKLSLDEDKNHIHVLVIIGASGDLAKKKTYPTLWWLFRDGLLPPRTYFVGFARSDISVENIRVASEKYAKLPSPCQKYEEFWSRNFYVKGDYTDSETFELLNKFIESKWGQDINRIFYYAIPPSVYKPVSLSIKKHCTSEKFCNQIFNPLWNRENIDNITISFKEPFGTEGRGGYFDQFGIIRDVVQNHLIQILSLVAMEKPISVNGEDIRDEKVSTPIDGKFCFI
ncbi:Glucose-6-phosphate 1-dehydrogenase, partial [Schistosoma japonicum]